MHNRREAVCDELRLLPGFADRTDDELWQHYKEMPPSERASIDYTVQRTAESEEGRG